MKKITIFSIIAILIDQIIKIIVSNNIPYFKSYAVIPNFFNITNVHNEGAAWSILSGNTFLLIFIAILVIAFIYIFLIRGKKLNTYKTITYSLLLGGIIGNLIDRIVFRYVIDYLEFIFGSYRFPVFNAADVFIVVSVMLLLLESFKEDLCKKSK